MFGWFKRHRKTATVTDSAETLEGAALPREATSEPEPMTTAVYDRVILSDLPATERRLAERVLQDARSGCIDLPSLPDLAIAVGRAANNPDASIEQLSRLIQVDLLMAAKVMQVANSAVFGGYSQVSTLQQAITRLGLQNTRDIVTSLAMKPLFNSGNPAFEQRMRSLWQRSTKVAAVSAVLARFAPGIDAERALLAGLMHDIGVLVIMQYAAGDHDTVYSDDELHSAIAHLRGVLGAAVLQHWNFEPALAQVPLYVANIEEHIPGPITYGDVVRVAKLHALFGTPELANYPPLPELSAFKKFGFELAGPDRSIDALREAKADIDAVRQTLNL